MLGVLAALGRMVVSLLGAAVRALSAAVNPAAFNFSVTVVRPDDLLVLTFEFSNLSPIDEGGADARLVRKGPGDALITVHFQPQSIVEEASHEDSDSSPAPPDLPIEARMSGESRLVFRVPDAIAEIPFTLEALLDWSRYEPHLAPVAKPPPAQIRFGLAPRTRAITSNSGLLFPGGFFSWLRTFFSAFFGAIDLTPTIVRPDEYTALEIPYRLFLSPSGFGAWAHARGAIAHGGRTELWHTRLGVSGTDAHPEAPGRDDVNESDPYNRTLRAIWSSGFPGSVADPFAVMALTSADQRQLVKLTSDFSLSGCDTRVINAEALMLTSLGAWMNVRYSFDDPKGVHLPDKPSELNLVEWRHRMSFGRDHYVRVVHSGYLCPFGHRAVLITISERKFKKTPDGKATAAYLRQREFIVVQQPEKSFGDTGLSSDGKSYDRMMPFKNVRITTLITPNLADPPPGDDGAIDGRSAFWIETRNEAGELHDFKFHLIGTDEAGQAVEFSAPLIFVADTLAFDEVTAGLLGKAFLNDVNAARRRYQLDRQPLAFAPPDSGGGTTFDAFSISMGVEVPNDSQLRAAGRSRATLEREAQPRFFPTVVESEVGITAAQRLLGTDHSATIKFSDLFLRNGFEDGNTGQVFAELVSQSTLTFPAGKSGGVVTPSFDITGLSRSLGPVGGDLAQAANLNFDPKQFFAGSLDAKILGSISLIDILKGAGGPFPALISEKTSDTITARFLWDTDSLRSAIPFDPLPGAHLFLRSESVTHLRAIGGPQAPTLHVEGRLTNFQFNLFGMIKVPFKTFAFVADTGRKLDVTADIDTVTFGGPLEFVNVLATMIPKQGFKDAPGIDVGPTGIKVGYSLGLPLIGGGLFSIQHVKFSAALNLPFILLPARLRFAFSERHDPFMVSIYGITGGGFVGIAIGLDGVEQLEASFEVGGSLAISLVVASGAVFIMLGVHFSWEKDGASQRVALAGYIRAGGAVEVLGLVTVSIEFYMELGFISQPSGDVVHGEASLTVEVEIAMFSKSVTLSIEKDLPAPV